LKQLTATTSGYRTLSGTILRFSVPLMLTNLLQLLYNTADAVVVGRVAGSNALAAVGSTSSIIILLVTLFSGISVGANYLVARHYGADDNKAIFETVHCAAFLSLILGVAAGVVGYLLSMPVLRLTNTPADIQDLAATYLRIYFIGVPALVVFNFGAAILRAVGETRYPLLIMIVSGTLNVSLNLILVICFRLGVAGVAIATSFSQLVSAVMVTVRLIRTRECYRLIPKSIRFYGDKAAVMMRVGISAGIQGIVFSIANVMVQSVVNTFGAAAVAGNSAATSLEGFIYTIQNAFYQAAITYTSQSVGAKLYQNISKVFRVCIAYAFGFGIFFCALLWFNQTALLGIYIKPDDLAFDAVMLVGITRIRIISRFQWLGGLMETACGSIRGLGKALSPTLVTLIGACALRIFWIYFAYAHYGTLASLYVVYPVSWAATFLAQVLLLRIYQKQPPYCIPKGAC
jgi:putative MATE family efflux protein